MSTRYVPLHFDEYVESHFDRVTSGERCTGCFGGPAIARDVVNLYCESCLRTRHGADQEEEDMIRAVVGGAVVGALNIGTSPALIHAIGQSTRREYERDLAVR